MPKSTNREKEPNLLPGINGVEEVLRHAPGRISSLLVSADKKKEKRIEKVLGDAREAGVGVDLLESSKFEERLAGLSSQGVAAELKDSGESSIQEIVSGLGGGQRQPMILVLDQISDVHNLGSLFRLAAAAGLAGLLMPKDNSARVSPAVRRISMGATELVPWSSVPNLSRALEELRKSDVWIYGATSHSVLGDKEVVSVYQSAVATPLALVLGSEEKGIRRLTEKSCDALLKLPMSGKIESLNVAQAGAVLVFEILRANGLNS